MSESSAAYQGDGSSRLAVSIVSNSRLLREGIQMILAPYLSLNLTGKYSGEPLPDASSAIPSAHVALIDSGIGRDLAIQWTKYWRSQQPPVPVVLLELANDMDVIISSIEAGVCGYTLEGAAPQEVAEAIRLASEGRAVCSPDVTAQLFARLAQTHPPQPAWLELQLLLTPREYEVLRYLVDGYSNKQIAAELVIELRTVKQHVHNILHKLNLENRWHAARVALEQHWFVS